MNMYFPSIYLAAGSAMRRAAVLFAAMVLSGGATMAQSTSYAVNNVPIIGYLNVGIGANVMIDNTTSASYNSALGFSAMYNNTSGSYNTAMGYRTLFLNTTGSNNTAIGANAMLAYAGNNSTAVGYRAMYYSTTGQNNTAVGAYVLQANTTGYGNTAQGGTALLSNTTGNENTAIGYSSAALSTTAWGGTAVGAYALQDNTTGAGNAALGTYAVSDNTTGEYNTGLGYNALNNCGTGNYNSGVGANCGLLSTSQTLSSAFGAFALVNASYKIRFGYTNTTVIEGAVPYSTPSDGRFKTDVRSEDIVGLAFIQKLRPVAYNFESRRFAEFLTQDMPDSLRKGYLEQDFDAATAVRQSGFIAQEVEQAAKEVGYDFNGVHVPENEDDNYSLAYSQFVVPLVKGMQEQQAMIEARDAEVAALKSELATLKTLVAKLAHAADVGAAAQDAAKAIESVGSVHPVEVFPNPSHGRFTVRIAPMEQGHYEVFDQLGQRILSQALSPGQTDYTIDLSGKASGSYLLRLHNHCGPVATKQLVVE